jgi:precorrin-8X/cobalt-precorrin-8 methylmutase
MDEKARSGEGRPGIYEVLDAGDSPELIERRSLEAIDREAPRHSFGPDQWKVVRRMIHATADFGLLDSTRFSPDAIRAAVAGLRAARDIYVDSNMIRAGLSLARLRTVAAGYGPEKIHCHVADEDVAAQARAVGLPRSLFAVRKARPILDGGIATFGNAPVALFELNRMIIEEGIRPALVIAMPVGFVHVVESKRELLSLGVPFIAVEGRRGGSPLAVSALHALCSIAAERDRT